MVALAEKVARVATQQESNERLLKQETDEFHRADLVALVKEDAARIPAAVATALTEEVPRVERAPQQKLEERARTRMK